MNASKTLLNVTVRPQVIRKKLLLCDDVNKNEAFVGSIFSVSEILNHLNAVHGMVKMKSVKHVRIRRKLDVQHILIWRIECASFE